MSRRYIIFVTLTVLSILFLTLVPPASADEGWVIDRFDAQIAIQPDGALQITETILADFGDQQKHGIFRDIPVIYDYDAEMNRVYDLDVESVTDVDGRAHQYEVDTVDRFLRIQIGDPDVEVSGPQSYRITYRVQHALNGFDEHDELYWNVNGQWPVQTERVAATVTLPGASVQRTTCYQGELGSQEPCRFTMSGPTATFETTRRLPEGEQLTVVVAMPKGLVPNPQPKLEPKPREFAEFFDAPTSVNCGALVLLVAIIGGLGWSWWSFGRDRRYTTIYYLTDDPSEETRPLLSIDPIVVEYKPPENLRPAQVGMILDESADTLDATATIVDLAVRGYLHITEVQSKGILGGLIGGGTDWELRQTDRDDDDLLPYEKTILRGLFSSSSPVLISDLKNKFYRHLNEAKDRLYKDAMTRRWFTRRPDQARTFWIVIGIVAVVLGATGVFVLGAAYGAACLALPMAFGGLLMVGMASFMPKRTARGREMLRRTLGFRQYIATAEKDRQQFNEQQNIFAEYLPYAIVFHCVDKWARAFEDVDTVPSTRGWYTGSSRFSSTSFSRNLQSFSSAVGSTLASTPGSSGKSGFSGGGSGGGGGGGGGGSW